MTRFPFTRPLQRKLSRDCRHSWAVMFRTETALYCIVLLCTAPITVMCVSRSCGGSMEALDGSYTGPAEEDTEEELLDPLSPMSSKRLKVSDINISR